MNIIYKFIDRLYYKKSEVINNYQKDLINYDKRNKVIQLNKSGTAYITIEYFQNNIEIVTPITFNEMWKLHPEQKHKIIMFNKEIQVHRYSKSYFKTPTYLSHINKKSYMYSGFETSDNNTELPVLFRPYYNYIKTIDSRFNQIIANWYKNENDYIALHADSEIQMIPNGKISIISIYPNDDPTNYRYLKIVPNNNSKKDNSFVNKIVYIRLEPNMIITMCGTTQTEFLHGMMKEDHKCSQRISLSFRQMQ
jgi:alkylated DNA repair dioxygenase AlkB